MLGMLAMKHNKIFVLIPLGLGLCSPVDSAHSADPDRGKLLYENHCLECHESQVHIRERRGSSSIADVVFQIDRWQQELRLNWKVAEMNDVLKYLDEKFYRFKERK